jgi:hypothetical protein
VQDGSSGVYLAGAITVVVIALYELWKEEKKKPKKVR